MATAWGLTCLLIGLSIVEICNTHPMEQLLSGSEGPNGQIMGALVAVMVSVCVVFTLLACVCCKRRAGFKVFRNSPVSASVINETSLSGDDPGHVNPIANAEFTIFTPLSPPHHNNNVFRSQPPVICYTENEANPELNKVINPQIDGIDVSEWFAETEYNFPRNCLKYTRELGTGWFGRVVEGEALSISTPSTWTPVAVRILESSASAHEQAQFLLEAAAYRAGAHPHLLQLLGRSLEATPLLLIQELCPKGDLKRFLVENKELGDSDVMSDTPLRYCTQLAAALQWLHEHNLPHLDLAARTCQISPDLSLKLGDYGLAVSQYPNDYYQGTPSIPVRWCAPESVNHTNTTLQPKQITLEANIWSLAVTFWEICEWGRMPYDWLTDDEVISQVMDAPNDRLPQPTFNAYYIPPLYRLMEYCWLPSSNRPQINQIYSMLIHLSKTYTSSPTTSRASTDFSTENFDLRWESFKPNTIIKTDNTKIKSASLTNLHGSFENLTDGNETVIQMDSWLENVASHTGDMQYVRGLSEAIHELDTALASEQTSSSSSFEPTPLSSLGAARSENILHMDDSSNLDSLIFPKRSESGSETEDETWKRRIERGAYSEKVRQKSKSVADLMVLTHIDMNTVRDIFQEELKKLQEERRESLLFVPVQSSETQIPSNQNLEIDKTKPSLQDSKLENSNKNQETSNFDTFLQSNTIDTVNQNILNSDIIPKITLTEYNNQETDKIEHIDVIPKDNYPVVQDFINNERQYSAIQSKDTNLEPAPTENKHEITKSKNVDRQNIENQLNEIIQQAEHSVLLQQSEENEENVSVLNNEDKKTVSSQVEDAENSTQQDIKLNLEQSHIVADKKEEITKTNESDKSVTILDQSENISKDQINLQHQENVKQQEDKLNLKQSHIVADKKEEISKINESDKSVTILEQSENILNQNILSQHQENIAKPENELNLEQSHIVADKKEEITKINETDKSVAVLKQSENISKHQKILSQHQENVTKQDNEINLEQSNIVADKKEEITKINESDKSVTVSEQSKNNNSNQEIVPQNQENITQDIGLNLEQSHIVADKKEEITKSNVSEKSVTFVEQPQIANEDIKKEINSQENLSIEDKEVITKQINGILQQAEDSVNNRLQSIDIVPESTENSNENLLKITTDFLLNEQQNKEMTNKKSELNSVKENITPTISNIEQELISVKTDLLSEPNLIDISPLLEFDHKSKTSNIASVEPSNILLQFDDSPSESENIKDSILENYLNSDLYHDSTVMPDLIETINSPLETKEQLIGVNIKSSEYSTIQDFINNERNNNQEDLITKPQIEEKTESNIPAVDITANLLDSSNVPQINQVFNVFNVTVDHNPPLECFSPVKNYLHPFDQNGIMSDINSLIETEKYENKFVNGISCEVNKFIDILEPKKLAQIALDSLKNNIDQYEMKPEEKINGHDEKIPKKLSELALESFKMNSLSEDSGFASVQCEDKISNGIKDSEDTSEDILKISVDSLEDILSNDENECEENARSPDELVTSFVEDEESFEPKRLSEIVQETINKTFEINKETPNLPDLILDNLQSKENSEILINIDSPVKSLSEKDESAIESDKNSPEKLSEIILDSLPYTSPVTSESTDNFSEKTVIEKVENSDICEEEISFPTSTPFKPKNEKEKENFFSFVSEGDEPSDCQTTVILGPCEDYGLGLYSGLKTTFGKFSDDDRPEEELLQFSSNFMPFTEPENSVDYSLETWDKFLGKSLQDQDECPSSVFDNFSPRPEGLDVFKKEDNLNKTVTINKNDATFTIDNDAPTSLEAENKDVSQAETTHSSWEPGEGWFLHPQPEADDLTGQIDISSAEIDNSYVGFALDEECENALRNELAAKLPHAQGISHEEPQEPEDWETEERSEIIVKYNVYATPLSPIPEESCCDDVYCDQIQHRDGSDSESDWSEQAIGQTSQLEDILVVDTETHTALILESPSLREPQHRHTPSQDSCCSNDTLFNLEDLNYGLSPQHHGTLTTTHSQDSDHILEIEITEDTPKQSPTKHTENSDSTEMNLTYTKPDININELDQQEVTETGDTKSKLELKLDPNAIGVAPLPSPEDIPWRQLPASLLTYDEVTQNDKYGQEETENAEESNLPEEITNDDLSDSRECTIEADLYSNLTDIRFSGPCDAQLMSTSFSEDAEERDWDSGSDTRSSSSGEFIWKGVMEEINPMDAIDEENSRSNSSDDSDDCEDEIEETEFVPSAWDAQATPTKSALRSPEKSNKRKNQQKGVWFKKQKYHCVYEYPREPESPVAPPSDLWRPLSDLSNFADWELDPESCIAPAYDDPDGGYDVLDKFITRSGFPLASGSSRHRDLYQLNPFPEFASGISASDEDFFISSSARPFQSVGQSSQFFPGQNPPKSKFLWQDYQSSSQQSSKDLSEGITPDSGIDDITPASISDIGVEMVPRQQVVPPLKCLAAIAADKTRKIEEKNSDSSLGGLRHTRNRLKLDLPPSPNSFTSTRTFSIDINNDPLVNREIPTFSTFGKTRFSVQHVTTPTEDISDPLQPGISKSKNVSFEALPHKPMKLTETVYIMDNKTEENHKPVEMVQGEASLLDSADEDSGIESSANATLERHQQQILN